LESIPTSKAQVASLARSQAQIPALDADRIPVFVSADMGGDDVVALLYLLSHPDVQVLGIGSSEGLAQLEAGAQNALRLTALTEQEHIPVAVGKEGPLEGDNAFPGMWRQGSSRPLSGAPQPTAGLVAESTAELLADVVNAYPAQVTVVILGAHTDVALALRDDPSLAERIKAIHIMGGAVHVEGNIHKEYPAVDNRTAEWNLWVDYRAASEVFDAGIPLTVVGLDATDLVKVDGETYEALASQTATPAAEFVSQLWKRSRDRSSSFFIWDVVAAVLMTLPEAAEWESVAIEIVTDEPNNLGQTRVREGGEANANVAVSVDAQAVLDEIVRVLNHPAP
jgi:inosine-uridine nucleoside N-ribohydrolase